MHLAKCVGFGQFKRQFVSVLKLKKFCDLFTSGTRAVFTCFSSYRPSYHTASTLCGIFQIQRLAMRFRPEAFFDERFRVKLTHRSGHAGQIFRPPPGGTISSMSFRGIVIAAAAMFELACAGFLMPGITELTAG